MGLAPPAESLGRLRRGFQNLRLSLCLFDLCELRAKLLLLSLLTVDLAAVIRHRGDRAHAEQRSDQRNGR